MKLQALALAVGLAMTGSSFAAVNNLNLTDNMYLGAFGAPVNYADAFSVSTAGSINHTLSFDITAPLYAGAGVSDVPLSLVFGMFTLTITDITGLNASIFDSSSNLYTSFVPTSNPDYLTLPASTYFAPGSYTLNVSGTAFGSNGGMYTVAAVTIPVPEPETWAMLLVGLGLVGMRLRQKAAATAL